jgi:serine/threonine protein kinase
VDLPSRYVPTGDEFSSGGMSEAFVCHDGNLDRLVLVKRLQDGVDQSRLLDEIAALTTIRSKHVVQMFDVIWDADGTICGLVEEYLPGDDLNAVIPITESEIFLRTAYAIACGVADIHERGRVHRDIKPANMKFDGEGCLKIFDFGLSRADDVDAKTLGTVGTPGYIAPELCVDDGDEVSFSQPVDVYAFGVTALKMVRGKLPGDIRKLPPKLPCAEADFNSQGVSLPPVVAEVLNSCLSVAPGDRPSMSQVRDTLAAHLLRNKHRATLVSGSSIHTLDASNPSANIDGGTLGSIQVAYDGLQFLATAVTGNITINNLPVKANQALPGSCVIILGDASLGWKRKYVTMDVSHPEVVL